MIDEKAVVHEDVPDLLLVRLDYLAGDLDDLAALTSEVLPDEEWIEVYPENSDA